MGNLSYTPEEPDNGQEYKLPVAKMQERGFDPVDKLMDLTDDVGDIVKFEMAHYRLESEIYKQRLKEYCDNPYDANPGIKPSPPVSTLSLYQKLLQDSNRLAAPAARPVDLVMQNNTNIVVNQVSFGDVPNYAKLNNENEGVIDV